MHKTAYKKHKTAQGFGSVSVFLFVCVIFSCVLYIFSTNNIAAKGDEIYDIEKEIARLSHDNEQLRIEETQLRSLGNIQEAIAHKDMEEIADPTYIDSTTHIALDE